MGSFSNAREVESSEPKRAHNLVVGGLDKLPDGADIGEPATIIDADPGFANASFPKGSDGEWGTADDGLRPVAESATSGLGDPQFLPADLHDLDRDGDTAERVPVDLAGFARVQGSGLDLGAYEGGNARLLSSWMDELGIPEDEREPLDRHGAMDLPNLFGYAFGIDPREAVPSDLPGMLDSDQDGLREFRFQQNVTALGIEFIVEVSEDLYDWQQLNPNSMEIVDAFDRNGDRIKTYRVNAGEDMADPRFYRLRIGFLE